MEHTVAAYIERRSSEELLHFLELCVQQSLWHQYAQAIPLILSTLQRRAVSIPEQIQAAWDCFIRNAQT